MDWLPDWLRNVNDQLVNLGTGIVQLIVVIVCAMLVARWARRRLHRRLSTASSPIIAVAVENSAVAGIYVIAFTIVLALWGLTWTGLVTALSIGTVAVAFGLQDLLRSVVGGVLVVVERPFALGDRIKIRDFEGRVEQIALRSTVIRADNGDRITVPNALVFSDPVVNRSPNRVSRVVNVTGVDGVPAAVRQRALDALTGLPGLDAPPIVSVRTKQARRRVRRALDALPGIDERTELAAAPRATGLRIVWTGDGRSETRALVKQRLQAAFPDAHISTGSW
jgi:small conductance mechanosensitive channel